MGVVRKSDFFSIAPRRRNGDGAGGLCLCGLSRGDGAESGASWFQRYMNAI